jgi:hypothetical protein
MKDDEINNLLGKIKELNEELINKTKELELGKFNKKKIEIEIKEYEPEVHLLLLAIQSVGVQIDYVTCDLINSTLKVFNKMNGEMTIMDSCKIKAEHEEKWDLFYNQKKQSQD